MAEAKQRLTRDLTEYVDRFGNIAVDVEIGGGTNTRGRNIPSRPTGANSTPAVVAKFLRELADDVERAGG